MKLFSPFAGNEVRWAYFKQRGKVYFFLTLPFAQTVAVFVALIVIFFSINGFEQGFPDTIEAAKEHFPGKLYQLVLLFFLYWAVTVLGNAYAWRKRMRKEREKQGR